MVKELYGKFGFEKTSEDASGNSVWKLETGSYVTKNTHIAVNVQ
jgi:hypothetical protein